ncbi:MULTISPECIES: M10 family metallopeptidase C-terminal domain-containing protein [unclassified Pseudomonas]|uniref:M10 family metallopeptidase C-terminal domain-containing protein n=1 Tax=unclassified Pseudomonas TaxID=196821 RepID=UPI000BC75F3C|nr:MULTISPECIES: calcium-binding protein [unclassified Pseudomonas]PVZ20158.1 putative delta-60 repeat protein [Pseudomonas sp. URIL14HWK12:I12]PVZ27224.1 putative delta-60 repeat protein [Pseudomonas sp. URIL14HWK12:I10]PVZ38113.1 putative delta-60 repeat protein [Pseudomonas sp. URIL14HWK12:I11]SNZ04521.1 delta-60 repeat domain-containing protein [Pseudomonas sp. URIL14HWK12:I9]
MATPSTHIARTSPGATLIDVSGGTDRPHTIAVQEDGKILVAGYAQYVAGGYIGSPQDDNYSLSNYALMRLNADGTLDSSFAQGGVAVIGARVDDDAGNFITVQPDGKIITSLDTGLVQRLNADGSLDTSFGGGTGKIMLDQSGSFYGAAAIRVGEQGSLYVTTLTGSDTLTVTKLNPDGSVDTRYGDQGTRAFSATHFEGLYATSLVMPDGSVLFGGDWSEEDRYAYSLVHVKADGSLDTGFGDGGKLVFDKALGLNAYSTFTAQPDGKILVTGSGDYPLMRLNSDGSLDTAFGDGGYALLGPGQPGYYGHSVNAVTVLEDGKILVTGTGAIAGGDFGVVRLNADGSVDTTFGSQDGQYHVDGYNGPDTLIGVAADEVMRGGAGDDVLQGGGGRDVLFGGEGADIFRFTAIDDSYRTPDSSHSDRIQDFNPDEDRIDLIGLGFTGLGNGLGGTLAVQVNAEGTRTYLKSFEPDADGHRFELAIDGNWQGQLTTSNVVFGPVVIEGTANADVIQGTAIDEWIKGQAGNDVLYGGAGNDILEGGAGRDTLHGGEGNNVFLYTQLTDSYRTDTQSFSDLIVDMDGRYDMIDVSALGFTGFGDGTGTTLVEGYSRETGRSYLKSYETDDQGRRFEISLTENWDGGNLNDRVIFASAAKPAEVEVVGVHQGGQGEA